MKNSIYIYICNNKFVNNLVNTVKLQMHYFVSSLIIRNNYEVYISNIAKILLKQKNYLNFFQISLKYIL